MSFILKSTPPPAPPSSGRASVVPPPGGLPAPRDTGRLASLSGGQGVLEGGVLDVSRWPLVVLVNHPRANEAQTEQFVKNLALVLRSRGGRFALLHDYRGTKELSPKQRKTMADHLAQNVEIYRRCSACAFVVDAAFPKGALTAIFWMSTPPYPYRMFPDVESAERWALGSLG
ncbi:MULTISPECIES: hypothetical protein [Polyangium]|uniref:STAS/SEC14 domain-containing protein n=2 Tax=Polyangium TaxID=55 RepID=A0A4U1IVF8_9BACT|nr:MULTISPECIES: hypothetical protein [Polyangium]MDI1430353.1 hypothetical protein [Polyangium sorediatum]TKC98441.1 hypothetical protein E8A74_41220 [Polyangium fumosum]